MDTPAKRVLLVEDDRFLRRACEASLRQRGFTVQTAADGEEGLRLARTEAPDIILLDLPMPKLSGLEVLRALKADAATRGLPVMVLSNSSRQQDIDEITRLGVVGYFVKADLSLQALGDRIAQLLSGDG
jgi:two-component system cell cycle response regulator DivK